jgi:hypothetical protein
VGRSVVNCSVVSVRGRKSLSDCKETAVFISELLKNSLVESTNWALFAGIKYTIRSTKNRSGSHCICWGCRTYPSISAKDILKFNMVQ